MTHPDTVPMLNELAKTLNEMGVAATVEYPGWLSVPANCMAAWHFGTANPTWGGELVNEDGTVLDSTDFEVPNTCTDVDLIASMIRELVR